MQYDIRTSAAQEIFQLQEPCNKIIAHNEKIYIAGEASIYEHNGTNLLKKYVRFLYRIYLEL